LELRIIEFDASTAARQPVILCIYDREK